MTETDKAHPTQSMKQSDGPYPQFILFGDSITQGSCRQELGFNFMPALQDDFVRRLDVLNRGFSVRSTLTSRLELDSHHQGYNTAQAKLVLPKFMPSREHAKVEFVVIFFGANDACLPGSATNQYVPLPEYVENLENIVRDPSIGAHDPRIILITPPPVNEYQMDTDKVNRTAANTRDYAQACMQAGKNLNVVVLDLWSFMAHEAGWKEGEPLIGARSSPRSDKLGKMLSDGLHFLPPAYKILYDSLISLIKEKWPDQDPAQTPYRLPVWTEAPK